MLRGQRVQLKKSFQWISYIWKGSKGCIGIRSFLQRQKRAGTKGCLDKRLFYLALLQNHNKYKVDKMEFTLIQKCSEVSCKSILQSNWEILYSEQLGYQKRKKYQALQNIEIWFQLQPQAAIQEQSISKQAGELKVELLQASDAQFPLKKQNLIGIMVIDNSLNQKRPIKDKKASKLSQSLKYTLQVIFSTPFILDFFLKPNSTSMFPCAENTIVLLNRSPFQILRTIIYPTSRIKHRHSTTLNSEKNIKGLRHSQATISSSIWTLRPLNYRILNISSLGHFNNSFQGHFIERTQGRLKKKALKTLKFEQRGQKLKSESLYCCSLQENQTKIQDFLIDRYSFQNSDPNRVLPYHSQSTQIMVDDSLDDDLLTFKKSLKKLRKSGLFSFFQVWNSLLEEYLKGILRNWDFYERIVRKDLTLFLRINQYKMLKAGCPYWSNSSSQLITTFYDLIYPNLKVLLKQILNVLQLQSLEALKNEFINGHKGDRSIIQNKEDNEAIFLEEIKNDLKIETQDTPDKLLYSLLQQYHSFLSGRSQLSSSFIADLQECLSKVLQWNLNSNYLLGISETDSLPYQNILYNLLFRVSEQIQNKKMAICQSSLEKEKASRFLEQLQNQKITDISCLGCSTFFYRNMNIFDENLCKVPLKTFTSIETITQIENELKDSICGMLNCGGGIILFDCQLSSRELVAKGYFLTELKKQSEERRIGSYLQCFYPPLQLNKNIQISFVPIVSNPLTSDRSENKKNFTGQEGTIKQYEWYYERSYVRGYYVTRIRVRPSNGTQVFYWYKSKKSGKDFKQEEIIDKYCCAFDGEKLKYLKIREMTKLIKRKFKSYFVPASCSPFQKMMMAKPFDVFGHECLKPEGGIQVAESDIKQVKSELVVVKDAIKRISQTSYEYRYPNMILLIVHKKHLQAIKQKLASLKISCEIERRFDSHNLRPAFNTAILYHDKPFQLLHKHLANDQQFNFANAKPMLLIEIKAYLKLERDIKNSPSKEDIQRYQSWLKKQFPMEKLKLLSYSLDRKRKQFYLTTESKLSALFMYFMMGHNGEKIVFRNPGCIDRPEAEGSNRLEVMYEGLSS